MTAAIIYLDPFRRRATGQPLKDRSNVVPIMCPDVNYGLARRCFEGDTNELLTVECWTADGRGEYRKTCPARELVGRTFGMPDGSYAVFASHFRNYTNLYGRFNTSWRVQEVRLNRCVLMPEDDGKGVA